MRHSTLQADVDEEPLPLFLCWAKHSVPKLCNTSDGNSESRLRSSKHRGVLLLAMLVPWMQDEEDDEDFPESVKTLTDSRALK